MGAQLEDFWKWPTPVERWKMRERELLAGKWEQEESEVSAAAFWRDKGLMDGAGRAWRPCGKGRAASERK